MKDHPDLQLLLVPKALAKNFCELSIVSWMNITLKIKTLVSLFPFILYVSYQENYLEGNELLM